MSVRCESHVSYASVLSSLHVSYMSVTCQIHVSSMPVTYRLHASYTPVTRHLPVVDLDYQLLFEERLVTEGECLVEDDKLATLKSHLHVRYTSVTRPLHVSSCGGR